MSRCFLGVQRSDDVCYFTLIGWTKAYWITIMSIRQIIMTGFVTFRFDVGILVTHFTVFIVKLISNDM
jgi:hypothetical protein